MAVVGILILPLTGPSRQHVLQGPHTVLEPVAPLPRPYEPRPADSGVEAHDIALLLPGFTDHEERHRTLGRTGGSQPCIAPARPLLAIPPRPGAMRQVVAFDGSPIGQI